MALDLQANIILQFTELGRRWEALFRHVAWSVEVHIKRALGHGRDRLNALTLDGDEARAFLAFLAAQQVPDPIEELRENLRRLNATVRQEQFVAVLRWELETFRALTPLFADQETFESYIDMGFMEAEEATYGCDDEGHAFAPEEVVCADELLPALQASC